MHSCIDLVVLTVYNFWCHISIIKLAMFFYLLFLLFFLSDDFSSQDWKSQLKIPPPDTRYKTEVCTSTLPWNVYAEKLYWLILDFFDARDISWVLIYVSFCLFFFFCDTNHFVALIFGVPFAKPDYDMHVLNFIFQSLDCQVAAILVLICLFIMLLVCSMRGDFWQKLFFIFVLYIGHLNSIMRDPHVKLSLNLKFDTL